jgi:hypothetical protein
MAKRRRLVGVAAEQIGAAVEILEIEAATVRAEILIAHHRIGKRAPGRDAADEITRTMPDGARLPSLWHRQVAHRLAMTVTAAVVVDHKLGDRRAEQKHRGRVPAFVQCGFD